MAVVLLADEPNFAPNMFKMLQESQNNILPFEITTTEVEYHGRLYFPLEVEKLKVVLDEIIVELLNTGELLYVTDMGTGKDYYNRTNKWHMNKHEDDVCD